MAEQAQAPASFMQSMQEAKSHGKAFFKSTIGAHPVASAVAMGILVIIILVLAYYVAHYRSKCKSGFMITPVNNLTTGNNNPEWQLGNMDAGNWGPIHREPTAFNVAVYQPGWRTGSYRRADGGGKEGLAPGRSSACAPGETPVTYQATDGSSATYCRSTDAMPGPAAVCGRGWDPAASAEAQALATVGSLEHRPFAEGRLRHSINAAYDSSEGMTDEQLTTLMHEGGAP